MFDVSECLERAAYCTKLAEAEDDPQLRHLFKTLADQWMEVARGERRSKPPRASGDGC
jgi:hypothetical protein